MIEVYSLPTCGRCKMLKQMLKQRNIQYVTTEVAQEMTDVAELPILIDKGVEYHGKAAINYVRKLK